jgi:Uma2 family endonuclease
MSAGTSVSLEEYLSTTYRPDRDYVDGELVERNVGEYDHGWTQSRLVWWLMNHAHEFQIRPITELRVQVKARRFRIPDVCAIAEDAPAEQIITHPPVLCIEVLSKDDSMDQIMERVEDYFGMGVPFCWILNPQRRRAWVATPGQLVESKDGILRAGHIEVPLAEIWP